MLEEIQKRLNNSLEINSAKGLENYAADSLLALGHYYYLKGDFKTAEDVYLRALKTITDPGIKKLILKAYIHAVVDNPERFPEQVESFKPYINDYCSMLKNPEEHYESSKEYLQLLKSVEEFTLKYSRDF